MLLSFESMINPVKKYVPVRLKKPLWYFFKSPQRKLGFFKSIWMEIRGLFYLLWNIISGRYKRHPRPVSICTGIKNRTSQYLDFVLPSILKMHHPHLIEISVFDCGSEDVELLAKKIKEKWKGKLVFHTEAVPFSRSYAFNRAIDQSSNSLFFAADADLSLPVNLVELCNKFVTPKTVWFPVCFFLFENKPAFVSKENGEWFQESKGMFAARKGQFIKAGKFDLRYKTWGLEDIDLWISFFKAGIVPIRNRCKGIIHHWHPSAKKEVEIPEHLKKLGIK
jgi:glycosyltransferase involved in cell wall biosynthesis